MFLFQYIFFLFLWTCIEQEVCVFIFLFSTILQFSSSAHRWRSSPHLSWSDPLGVFRPEPEASLVLLMCCSDAEAVRTDAPPLRPHFITDWMRSSSRQMWWILGALDLLIALLCWALKLLIPSRYQHSCDAQNICSGPPAAPDLICYLSRAPSKQLNLWGILALNVAICVCQGLSPSITEEDEGWGRGERAWQMGLVSESLTGACERMLAPSIAQSPFDESLQTNMLSKQMCF